MRIEGINNRIQYEQGEKRLASRTKQAETKNEQIIQPSHRSITEAMLIIQKAQNIVSQALSVSSRLVNMASATMTSGNIDRESVAKEISGIDSSLAEFGSRITTPPFDPKTKDAMDQTGKDISDMKNMIFSDIDQEKVSELNNKFSAAGERLAEEFNKYEKKLFSGNVENEKRGNLLADTLPLIRTDPVSALSVQGNINQRNAGLLV